MCLANISIDCMLIESECRELEAFDERKMIKRLEWNVNEEITEDILKAEEKYNMYKNTYFLNINFYIGLLFIFLLISYLYQL